MTFENYNEKVVVPKYNNEKSVGTYEYTKNLLKDPKSRSINYVRGLFPFIDWFPHYPKNWNWVLSDFITGVTVAIVLVPQSMSYAKLAELSPQFGLYSAFVGLVFYFIFATSREICIGPVAVLSMEVGKIVSRVQEKYGNEYSANEIATSLALVCGGIVLGIGLLRLGFIVELISLPAIMAFTTGSAFNIICGQLPGLMGYSSKVDTHHSPAYKILINFLKNLPNTKVDAAFGLTDLFILYLWQFVAEYFIKKYEKNPKTKLGLTYLLNLRTAFVIIISTCISFGVLRNDHSSTKPYKIIGNIPAGLNHVGSFKPPAKLISRLASDIPICTIVLVLEHISISKSFARLNGYRVNPNQEFIAIGFTNMVGTFFGAYPVTGSFSRTALSAKCGVKTPFKSAFSGACVLLAIYCFTSGFYYIPSSTLCAIIIHCVTSLLSPYTLSLQLYMYHPIDFVIFIVGVFVCIFSSIENGIYWAICASCANILWRQCITNGSFLGRIKMTKVKNPTLVDPVCEDSSPELISNSKDLDYALSITGDSSIASNNNFSYKWVALPSEEFNPSFIHTRYINEDIYIEDPPPGVFVYRLSESFIYTNCSAQIDNINSKIRKSVRPHDSDRERLWCEYKFNDWKKKDNEDDTKELLPKLRLIHLDFSQVVAIDATSIQTLIDLKNTIDNFAGSEWELHFSGIISPWVLRALKNAGFGRSTHVNVNVAIKEYMYNSILKQNSDYSESDGDFEGNLEVALSDGSLLPLADTDYPFIHEEIPSYSEYY